MTPDDLETNPIQDAEVKKIEALKKAVSNGTYAVSAEHLNPKIMESMFRNSILDEAANRPSRSQLEVGDQFSPQNSDGLKIPSGAIISHKDSRSGSASSDGSPSGQTPKLGSRNGIRSGTGDGPDR